MAAPRLGNATMSDGQLELKPHLPVIASKALALAELARLEWTRDLQSPTLEALGEAADLVEVSPGEKLIEHDAPLTHCYFLVLGKVKTTLCDATGKRIQEFFCSRGAAIGLFALASYDRAPMTVVATEQALALRITLQSLMQLMTAYPDFQLAVLRLGSDIVKHVVSVDRSLPRPSVAAIVHLSEATRPLTAMLARRLHELGETVAVAGDDPHFAPTGAIPFRTVFVDGKPIDQRERESILREWARSCRLFVDVRLNGYLEETIQLLANYAETILWCVTPAEAELAAKLLRQIESKFPWWCGKTHLVWVLSGDTTTPPYVPELVSLVPRDFKVSFEAPKPNQGKLLSQGLERIVRYLRGVQIGLALGGGAARGMAHLGVLRALERHGIFVDRIAGTSAGAMTGTVYSVGMSPEYSTHCFKTDLQPSWFFRQLPGGGYWYLLHQYRRNRFGPMLRKYLHDYLMEQLTIPMTTIAVDLVEGEPLIRTTGDATKNILESINLPPLSLPIFDRGQAVVDGGLLNNVPANVLTAQGCNFVIASTVTAKLEKDFMNVRASGKPKLSRFGSSIQVIMRQNLIQSYSMNSVGVQPADFVIAPDVTSFDLSEFTRADEMAVVGDATATDGIAELKALLSRVDSKLFPV